MYNFNTLPLGTKGRLSRVPVMTVGLVLSLVVIHFLLDIFGSTTRLHEVFVLPIQTPTLLQSFTACFVHPGLLSLTANMIVLLTLGPALESRIGRGAFLGVYLLSGLVSMFVQIEVSAPGIAGLESAHVLGATGALGGLLGVYTVRCWFLRLRVPSMIPSWLVPILWMGAMGISTVALTEGSNGVATFAGCLSGLALGVLAGIAFRQIRVGQRERRLMTARRHFEKESWSMALEGYEALGDGSYFSAEAMLGKARCLRMQERGASARDAYEEALDLHIRAEQWEVAGAVAAEMSKLPGDALAGAEKLAWVAENLEEDDKILQAAELFEQAGRTDNNPARGAGSLERAADILRSYLGDLKRAAEAYSDAAERLVSVGWGVDKSSRVQRLRGKSEECRRALAKRMRFAVGGS
jgi:membrane associated rhomboid family serine protease